MKAIKKAIKKEDLAIHELANTIADVIIEDYGKHNYVKFLTVVAERFNNKNIDDNLHPTFKKILSDFGISK